MGNESTGSLEQAERVDHQLVRGIGIPALTANIISSTIGAGIFVIAGDDGEGTGIRRRLWRSSAVRLPWCCSSRVSPSPAAAFR